LDYTDGRVRICLMSIHISSVLRRGTSSIFFVLLLAAVGFGQDPAEWMAIVSGDSEFEAEIPPEMIVNNDIEDHPRLILSSYEVRIEISRRPNPGRKGDFLSPRNSREPNTTRGFDTGSVIGRVYTSERPGRAATLIDASSSRYIYFVAAYARRPDDPNAQRFLSSIKFGGKYLFSNPALANRTAAPPKKIEDLENSALVKEYLRKPSSKDVAVRFEAVDVSVPVFNNALPGPDPTDQETRSLIVLRMPKPAYRPWGERVSGTVTAQVSFMGTGQIGEIVVDPKLDRGLAEAAVDAARQIKFIPAEVAGKLVDVKRRIVYNFMAR